VIAEDVSTVSLNDSLSHLNRETPGTIHWLASVAPDSLAIPDRLTYTSPIAVEIYERVHRLRLAELEHALQASRSWPWVDRARIVLAGTSEGAVAVSRYAGVESSARLIYWW